MSKHTPDEIEAVLDRVSLLPKAESYREKARVRREKYEQMDRAYRNTIGLGINPDAVPDLLEAAKYAAMEWRLHGQLTDSCRVLEAAIAKAEA